MCHTIGTILNIFLLWNHISKERPRYNLVPPYLIRVLVLQQKSNNKEIISKI